MVRRSTRVLRLATISGIAAAWCLLPLSRAYAQLPTIMITPQQAQTLFNGDSAKLIMCWPTASDQPNSSTGNPGTTYLLDFSATTYAWKRLTTKSKGWMGDPMISWDGTRYLYNTGGTVYVGSIQDTSIYVSLGTGYDQRWWVHPTTGDEYVMWVDTKWANGGNDGVAGQTFMRKLTKGTCNPAAPQTAFMNQYAFRCGRSADGKYMFTVQPGRICAEVLPSAETNAFVRFVWSDFAQTCNGTYNTDINRPKGYAYLEDAHDRIFQGDGNPIMLPTGYCCNVWLEWSTHPDYLITNAHKTDNGEYNPALRDIWIYQASKNQWTQVSTGAGPAHLWVKRASGNVVARERVRAPMDRPVVRATTGISGSQEFEVTFPGAIRVSLMDAGGRRIAQAAGTDAALVRCPAGIRAGTYLVSVEGDGFRWSKRVTLE